MPLGVPTAPRFLNALICALSCQLVNQQRQSSAFQLSHNLGHSNWNYLNGNNKFPWAPYSSIEFQISVMPAITSDYGFMGVYITTNSLKSSLLSWTPRNSNTASRKQYPQFSYKGHLRHLTPFRPYISLWPCKSAFFFMSEPVHFTSKLTGSSTQFTGTKVFLYANEKYVDCGQHLLTVPNSPKNNTWPSRWIWHLLKSFYWTCFHLRFQPAELK